MFTRTSFVASAMAAAFLPVAASASVVLPAIETFDTGAAAWFDGGSVAEVDWVASGGVGGSGYVTDTIDLPTSPPPFGLTAFRAQDEFGSSGGIFEGDWIAAGATELRFSVRHDGPAPISFFARFASPANFPAAAGVVFTPVLPGVWTELAIDLTPDSPQLVLEGVTYEQVFSNIGHLQIGFDPGDLGGFPLTVDLDSVVLVPTPAALPMLLLGLAGVAGRRRG